MGDLANDPGMRIASLITTASCDIPSAYDNLASKIEENPNLPNESWAEQGPKFLCMAVQNLIASTKVIELMLKKAEPSQDTLRSGSEPCAFVACI